jgi:hypothetical protein
MTRLTALYVRWRYLVLLAALLIVLVVQPVSFGFAGPPELFDAFLVLVTVALLLSFCPDRNRRVAAIAFGVPTGLLSLGGHLLPDRPRGTVVMTGHGLAVALFAWAAVLIVASLLRRRSVSLDSVFGSVCGYLLLGMAWGVLYSMLETARPGSFAVGERLAAQVREDQSPVPLFTYYSFITLTTVGYGDVTPVSTPARTCAWLEALTGQFYLAVLVAGLVGALLVQRAEESGGDGGGPHTSA